MPRIYDFLPGPQTLTVGVCSCAHGGLFLNRYRHLLKDTGLPCCVEAYADRADTYVRTYHATTGQTRPPHTPTSTALRQDCPPPPTPPPHPRLWASSSASASSKVQAAWLQRLARSASRGRDGEGGNSVSAVVCKIEVRAVAGKGVRASTAARPVSRKV